MDETFSKGFDWIKKHPAIAIVAGGGLILLLFYIGSGSSSGSSSTAPGQVDPNAALAAQTQIQLAEIAAGIQSGNTQASLTANQENIAGQEYGANLSYQLQNTQLGDQFALSMTQLEDEQQLVEGFLLNNSHDPRWVASAFGTDTPPSAPPTSDLIAYLKALRGG